MARSVAEPDTMLTDPVEWQQLWWDARDRIANREVEMGFGRRWVHNATQPACA